MPVVEAAADGVAGRDLPGELLGQPLVVVVAEGDQLAGGSQDAAVAGPGQARGALVELGTRRRPLGGSAASGQVGVALVEDDHASIRPR